MGRVFEADEVVHRGQRLAPRPGQRSGVFAKHLPPSAGLPRVLVLGPAAAAELAGLVQMVVAAPGADDWPAGPFVSISGPPAPDQLLVLIQRLRPGGRLILSHIAEP